MTEEIYKTEEFYKDLYNASKTAVRQYFKNSFDKESLVDAGIDYVLKKIEAINLTGEREHDFELLKRMCCTGMQIYIYNQRTIFFQDISDDDSHIKVLRNYSQDKLSYDDFKKLLTIFLKEYDIKSKNIIITNIRLKNMVLTSKELKISLRTVARIINKFRQDFADFLLACGYLENLNYVLVGLKAEKKIAYFKKSLLRCKGVLSYDSYLNDFKIYKLLREEKDLKKFADCIDKPVEYLDKVIYHKVKKLNLTFYEIQKLRVKFYSNYSFLNLVSVC